MKRLERSEAIERLERLNGRRFAPKAPENTRLAEKRLKTLVVEWSDPVAANLINIAIFS
jgi:hypothetical protein